MTALPRCQHADCQCFTTACVVCDCVGVPASLMWVLHTSLPTASVSMVPRTVESLWGGRGYPIYVSLGVPIIGTPPGERGRENVSSACNQEPSGVWPSTVDHPPMTALSVDKDESLSIGASHNKRVVSSHIPQSL